MYGKYIPFYVDSHILRVLYEGNKYHRQSSVNYHAVSLLVPHNDLDALGMHADMIVQELEYNKRTSAFAVLIPQPIATITQISCMRPATSMSIVSACCIPLYRPQL